MKSTSPARASVRRTRSTLLAEAVVGALALVGLPLVLAAPAAAHDELVSTLPADGSSVAAAPAEVTLTFGEEAQALGTAVVVTDAAGVRLAAGAAVVDGPEVAQAIDAPTVAGPVRVSYRVVSADGHPVTGTFTFSVAPAAQSSQSASPSASASATAVTSSAASEPAPSAVPIASGDDGSALPWILGGLAVLALAGAAVAAGRRGRAGSSS